MASQITSLTIVYSTVYWDEGQWKHQSSASLALVRGIHRWPVNSPHKGSVSRKVFPFNDVITRILSVHLLLFWMVHCGKWKWVAMTWRVWAFYQIRKIASCACAGNAGNAFPPLTSKETAIQQSRHASRHVRDARAVRHVGIANPRWRIKRSRHSRRMRNPQFHVSDKRPVTTAARWHVPWLCMVHSVPVTKLSCGYHFTIPYNNGAWPAAFLPAFLKNKLLIHFQEVAASSNQARRTINKQRRLDNISILS